MSLATYHAKRKFSKTPEPRGRARTSTDRLHFVVQKHQARRLHYDFRLEIGGVLKSWALPKGPPMRPDEKRLAMMTEDHPLEYKTFEGIIPKGQYGAGQVTIWDQGTYADRGLPREPHTQRGIERQLKKGHMSLALKGKRLRGEFALVRLKRTQENAWLLLKKKGSGLMPDEPQPEGQPRLVSRKHEIPETTKKLTRAQEIPLKPMLATLTDKPFDREGWIYELKWDGYRAKAVCRKKNVELYSRNEKLLNEKYPEIVGELEKLNLDATLDGEIVVLDAEGRPRFQWLQNYPRERRGNIRYNVFDLLSLRGKDIRSLSLLERKKLLRRLLAKNKGYVQFCDHVEKDGMAFFKEAVKAGFEGVMAKDGSSPYRSGIRGTEWLKMKSHLRQEVVIAGYTEPKGSRKDLGALVLGIYQGGKLTYIGHTAGRLGVKDLADMRKRLAKIEQKKSPFAKPPKTNAPVHWVKPQLVVEVSFQEWTQEGHMRQPIFIGLREDKKAKDVKREAPLSIQLIREKPADTNTASSSAVHFTNVDKVFWPKEGYTKGDVIEYYRAVGEMMLPYLKGRPESLNRHPNGMKGENFFQKDVGHMPPAWVKTVKVFSKSNQKTITYLVCEDIDTLLYMANLGCIEINPWNSHIGSLDKPDYLIFDLDPEDIGFSYVVETAKTLRSTLESLGITSYPKTSGKTGLHIYVPLDACYTFKEAKTFAQLMARIVHEKIPAYTSVERLPKKRKRKVYVDYLQNNKAQTLCAPYSLRPWPGATVSTPLEWSEVTGRLRPEAFTIKTVPRRIDKKGDLWKPVIGSGIDIEKAVRKLS